MKTHTKLILLGAVAVSLASLAPLATHAADNDTALVQVQVSSSLTIDSATKEVSLEATPNAVKTSEIAVTVSSNQQYTISLHATEGAGHTALADASSSQNIPAADTLEVGKNGWGIRKTKSVTGTAGDKTAVDSVDNLTNYTALPAALGPDAVFYRSPSTGEQSAEISFPIGIAISSDLPSGTYATSVTVTASAGA